MKENQATMRVTPAIDTCSIYPTAIKIKRITEGRSRQPLPSFASEGAAGMDLYCALEEPATVKAGSRLLIPTGIALELPHGLEAQVRPRSGLALKHGITVLNAPGTIDCDYRGEVGVVLYNTSDKDFTVKPGERIAQMVIAPYIHTHWIETQTLSDTERADGGWGHSGV